LAQKTKYKIIVFNSYHKGYSWSDRILDGINDVLADDKDIQLYFEYMDTKHYHAKKYFMHLKNLYMYKFNRIRPDVIITSDDYAFDFVLRNRDVFFPGTPLVFCGVNEFNINQTQNKKYITGVIGEDKISETIDLSLRLHPSADMIAVVTDFTKTGLALKNNITEIQKKYSNRVKIFFLNNYSKDDTLNAVKKLPDNSIILFISYMKTGNGKLISDSEGRKLITQNSRVPVYYLWDDEPWDGFLGGRVKSSFETGKYAAKAAKLILSGQKNEDLRIIKNDMSYYKFNYKQLKRFGIKLSSLPHGSIIRNKPDSFYFRYKKLSWFITGFILFQTGMIGVLAFNISKRRKAEKESSIGEEKIRFQNEDLISANTKLEAVNQELVISKDEIEKNEKKIMKLNEDLERRVEERTLELNDSIEKLNNTRDQLIQSEKMASLGALVAGIAHEINTPVGISVTGASFLNEKTRETYQNYSSGKLKDVQMEEYFTIAIESTDAVLLNLYRASKLIRNFKQVAVDQVVEEKRKFNLNEYIGEIMMAMGPNFRRTNHEINIRCPEWIFLNTYPGVLSQVITSLMMNSIIHGFADKEDGIISLDVSIENEICKIIYRDNGKGMAKETVDRIFDPFFTTSRIKGSVGLGMHIVFNQITQKMRGYIECNSESGMGTEFILTIPVDVPEK